MKTQLMTPAAFAGTLLICLSALSLADSAVLDENWAKRLVDVDGVSEAHVEAGEAIGVETPLFVITKFYCTVLTE